MKRRWSALVLIILAAVVAAVFWHQRTAKAADDGINLQISPLPINLNVDPGKTVTADLRVRNAGTKTEHLKVVLNKFVARGETGEANILPKEVGDDYFDWVSFSRTNFDAPPNEWQTIRMTITVPKSAAFGYYYAVIFTRDQEVKNVPGATAVQGEVAVFVLLDVQSPGAKRQLDVAQFISKKKLYEYLPADLEVTVRNSGNVHAVPRGSIFITQHDHDLAELIINSGKGNVLPRSNRLFTASWDDGFPRLVQKTDANGQPVKDKQGRSVMRLEWNFGQLSKLRIGKYTARLVMVYDDGQRDVPVEGSVSFYVFPWKLALVALTVVLLVFYGIYSSFRGIIRRMRGTV